MKKAFLLDRDGTINVDTGYVRKVSDVKLLDGAGEAIRLMNEAGYLVVVVSNQSGVARGLLSMDDVDRVNEEINRQLREMGAHIDCFYVCPHYEEGCVPPYNVTCTCRKPDIGLYQKAIQENEIDVSHSFAAGDRLRDVERVGELGIFDTGIIDEKHYSSLLEYTKKVLGKV